MKRKLLTFICAAVCVTGLLAGCSTESETDAAESVTEEPEDEEAAEAESQEVAEGQTIGLSMPIADGEFLKGLIDQIESRAEAEGYEITTVSAEGEIAKQVEQIENFISMGVDILVTMPTDDSSLNDVLRQSKDAGIITIAIGCNPSDTDCYTYCLNTDKAQQGQVAAQSCAEYIEATWPDAEDGSIEVCLLLNSMPGDSITLSDELTKIEEYTSKAKVVVSYDLQNETNPSAKTQEYISLMTAQYPDVQVILSYCDTYAMAANELLMQEANIDKDTFGIICADKSDASVQLLKDSETGESLLRGVGDLGDDLSDPLFKALVGEIELDENNIAATPVLPVTIDNVDEYLK